ncbi:MAG: peptide-binding protein, partial [Rhodococcus sp. (in: high G+C Gram-positive bacteria)]
MSENGNDAVYGETPAETTSVFRADFLNELDNSSATQAPEAPVSGVEGLPAGSALL